MTTLSREEKEEIVDMFLTPLFTNLHPEFIAVVLVGILRNYMNEPGWGRQSTKQKANVINVTGLLVGLFADMNDYFDNKE